MKTSDMVKKTIESGITPIELDFEKIVYFEGGKYAARSFMVLNSLDLGTLTYRQYRFVARRTKQGDRMVERHIQKLLRKLPSLIEADPSIEFFSVPVYARLLKDGILSRILFDSLAIYDEVDPLKICIELSADILYEDIDEARARIHELLALGVRVAIGEVGDKFCPVFRLAELDFQYAFLDKFATDSLGRSDDERVCGSLVKYLKLLNVKVIAPELSSDDQIESAKRLGCDGYTVGGYEPFYEDEDEDIFDIEEVSLP